MTGHRIDNEQYLARLDSITDIFKLLHELLINMKSAGCVEKNKVVAVLFCMLYRSLGNVHRIGGAHLEDGNVKLLADGFELFYSRGTVNVAGCQQRALALLAHIGSQLCTVCRFACALKTDEHDNARRL